MVPLITQALSLGYTAFNILNFLGNKIPGLGGGIKNAKKQGYGDEDILKFLQNKLPSGNGAQKHANEMEKYYSSIGLKTKSERQEQKGKFIKGALGVAGTALGAYNLYKNYSGIWSQLTGKGGTQTPTPQGQQPFTTPGQQIGANVNPPNPSINPMTAQNQTTPQPQQTKPQIAPNAPMPPQPAQIDSQSIINQMGLSDRIKTMVKAGNNEEGIGALLNIQMTPGQKQWLKSQTDMPITDIVKDYLSKTTQQEAQLPEQIQVSEAIQQPEEIAQRTQQIEPSKEIKQPQQIARGSTVITPEGDITEIESLPGKTAKVRIDGKSKIYDPEDLIPEPENKDEILATYEKLISQIPEQHRSAILNWVGYDPDRNLLQVKFHNGASYTYENIPPEFADKLKDAQFMAKTTGNSYYGAWEQGESSRGAGIYQLIKELQKAYGGKGNEYSGKFSEVYSFLGIPEQKLREKLTREREEKKKKRKGNS